jgi:gliding motility-associated-like protein
MRHFIPFAFLLMCFLLPSALFATHNRAGEIRVEQIGGCNSLKLRATIYTWTKASNTSVDRDTLDLCWGDGFCEKVVRRNGGGNGVVLPNDVKFNEYVSEHTFSGPGMYRISMTDPNRIVGILNVNPPSSDAIPFHIETIYTFQDPQFGGCNSTPQLFQPPVDDACIGKPFRHNPNAFDPDDDSLSYHLFVPLQGVGTPSINYFFPTQIAPGANNLLTIDPVKGDLLWLSPQRTGEYNIAIIIVSWRDGQPIDTTIRDMQILVESCDNNPPEIKTIDEACVVAGDSIEFEATATDSDPDDRVRLTVLGGPLSLTNSPAEWTGDTLFRVPPVSGKFKWKTTCDHISGNPYTVVFKAEDDAQVSLIDLHSVSIRVVGPPPLDVKAEAKSNAEITVTWEKPYICESALNNYFYGFSVWRREGSNPFTPDTCEIGLAGKGYTQIKLLTKDMANGRYVYIDKNVEPGKSYCYRILAKFARTSSGGYPYNVVESLPSKEACVQLPRSLPILTHVSITETDQNTGKIYVQWAKPLVADLDTVLNPPPYRYRVFRANGQTIATPQTGAPVFDRTYSTLSLSDTFFTDLNLDTRSTGHVYTIEFSSAGKVLGYAPSASSVFVRIQSSDKINRLSWSAKVPWQNSRYDIFWKAPGQTQFDSLTSVTTPMFAHTGLDNGQSYCYYVRARGSYGIIGVVNPLLNLSQEACGVPIDTLAPCAPAATLKNICIDENLPNEAPFFNYLKWPNSNNACDYTDDTYKYNVYFSPDSLSPLTLLATVEGAETTTFNHQVTTSLAGCYAISAIDTIGNESVPGPRVCATNCPLYELPNVFTPNSDNQNDVFKPFAGYRFVTYIELQIFNRWGNLVFNTTNPAINWNGQDTSGNELASGTYFYVGKAFTDGLNGRTELPGVLNGFVELIRP